MLEEYFLLVRRIPGISLSPSEYWELDIFTTQKLLDLEKEVIKQEQESYGDSKEEYSEFHEENSDEMMSIIEEMQE